jgi:hypothetical protein
MFPQKKTSRSRARVTGKWFERSVNRLPRSGLVQGALS